MKEGRIQRNRRALYVFIMILVVCLYNQVNITYFKNYVDVLNGLLSLSGFATAVVFAAYSLIPQFSKILVGLKASDKFRDRLLVTTILFSVICILSLIGLAFFSGSEHTWISISYMSLLMAVIASTLEEMFEIFNFMLQL